MFPPVPNRAWRSHLRALVEDWQAGEVDDRTLCDEVLDVCTPETAAEALQVLGPAASRFEHGFVAAHGNRIPVRRWMFWPGHWKRVRRIRVIEAFHRAILANRAPL